MLIALDDPDLLHDLLRFLRSEGCIAYVYGETQTIEALRPHAFGEQEASEIRALVERWRAEYPDVQVDLSVS